jgi:hypothetical protein
MNQKKKDKLTENHQGEPPNNVDRLSRVKALLDLRRAIAVDPLGYAFAYHVAQILRKTYVVCGDAASVTDDQALMMINDMLLKLDPEMLQRTEREQRRWNTKTRTMPSEKNKMPKKAS